MDVAVDEAGDHGTTRPHGLLRPSAHLGGELGFGADPGDGAVLDALVVPWWLLIVLVLLGGVVFALDGVLLGAADVSFLRNATIASVVLGFIPVVWLAWIFGWGLTGVWCGLLAFIALRLLAVWWRYRGDAWLRPAL